MFEGFSHFKKGFAQAGSLAFFVLFSNLAFSEPPAEAVKGSTEQTEVAGKDSNQETLPSVSEKSLQNWTDQIPIDLRLKGAERFPVFFLNFLAKLEEEFVKAKSPKEFIELVKQNTYFADDADLGHLETKFISDQVCIRFSLGQNTDRPVDVVFVNVPLTVNSQVEPIEVSTFDEPNELEADPTIVNNHLDRYRSKSMMNRKVSFRPLDILRRKSIFGPAKSFAVIDLDGGEFSDRSFTPSFEMFDRRFPNHFVKGTYEPIQYKDIVRGQIFSHLSFGIAVGLAALGQAVHPDPNPVIWGPAVASAYGFGMPIATASDTYMNFVRRGDNALWQMAKRLLIGALLAYPIAVMQAHGDWSVVLSFKTNFMVWGVGFADRFFSTVTNVIPNLDAKFVQKPWFFPQEMKSLGQDFVADLTNDEELKQQRVQGVTYTREVLALPKFAFKFAGLFLDPMLMQFTTIHMFGIDIPVPVVTLFFWTSGLGMEVYNQIKLREYDAKFPQMRRDIANLKKDGFIPKVAAAGRGIWSCLKAVGRIGQSFTNSFKDSYYPPF